MVEAAAAEVDGLLPIEKATVKDNTDTVGHSHSHDTARVGNIDL